LGSLRRRTFSAEQDGKRSRNRTPSPAWVGNQHECRYTLTTASQCSMDGVGQIVVFRSMCRDRPLVTALINTYNYCRYLSFAINSVLDQTYPHIEIIVVDDGSTDHTPQVLAQYKGRVRTTRTENGGQGQAFNIGIPMARGELVMLLDADDMWLPSKAERMVALAAERPYAAMLYHRFQNVDRNGREIAGPQPFTLTDGDFRSRYFASGGSWWGPITSVMTLRPDHIKSALPIPTYAHREGADAVLADYCIATSEIASIPEVLTIRRLHGSNLYATGRDDRTYRSRSIRESDSRRTEWRMFSLRNIFARLGSRFEIDIDRNEWRMINLYWLGRASLLKIIRATLLSPEHTMRLRWERLKWVIAMRKIYRGD
jgi:glycosyltransferase involved in cell wall biosynthesis